MTAASQKCLSQAQSTSHQDRVVASRQKLLQYLSKVDTRLRSASIQISDAHMKLLSETKIILSEELGIQYDYALQVYEK